MSMMPLQSSTSAIKPLPKHLKRLEAEVDRDHAGSGRGISQAGDALLDRQRPSVMLHRGHQGLSSGAAALSAVACRHHLEISRDDLLPRRNGAAARSQPDCLRQPGRPGSRRQPDFLGLGTAHPRDEDGSAEAGARHLRIRAAFGGARRDEEKSRAKERIFSFRSKGHVWDPRNQRPELWNLFNTRIQAGESIRVFPLSNWTELDVWQYVRFENIPVVPLYFAKVRPVVRRNDNWIMVDDERLPLEPGEGPQMRLVRFRTLGCYPLTGAIESSAATVDDIVAEMRSTKISERQGRLIDNDETASMEKKKREGYF